MESRYQPPNRQTLSDQLIPAIFEIEKTYCFKNNKALWLSLLQLMPWHLDLRNLTWKKTCHFVNKDWKLCSRILQTGQFLGSHKGERVGFELKDCMLNWGILVKFNITRIALRVMSRSSVLGDNSYGDTRSWHS